MKFKHKQFLKIFLACTAILTLICKSIFYIEESCAMVAQLIITFPVLLQVYYS